MIAYKYANVNFALKWTRNSQNKLCFTKAYSINESLPQTDILQLSFLRNDELSHFYQIGVCKWHKWPYLLIALTRYFNLSHLQGIIDVNLRLMLVLTWERGSWQTTKWSYKGFVCSFSGMEPWKVSRLVLNLLNMTEIVLEF